MSDDFIIEEEEQANGNRPFLIAAGALLTVFILAAACTGILLINRNGGEDPATAEAIAARIASVGWVTVSDRKSANPVEYAIRKAG